MATLAEIDALFLQTLKGDYESDEPWGAINKLRNIGTREVFDRAVAWVQSDDDSLRLRGIDVLAQLGKTMEHPETVFASETLAIVLDTLGHERVPAIINSCIIALSHVGGPANLPTILSFLAHSDPDVRHSVAFTLGSFSSDSEAIQGLLILMQDKDKHVRDWATFGLGKSAQPDSVEIRDAFLKRVRDRHRETREEAICGLSNRKDLRVLPSLIRELQRKMVSHSVIESACELLDMPAPGWDDDWDVAGLIKLLENRFPNDVRLAS